VQPPEIDALLEIDLHAARRLQRALPPVPGIGGVVQPVGGSADATPGIDGGDLDAARLNFLSRFAGH
jgi:hypothetical protein